MFNFMFIPLVFIFWVSSALKAGVLVLWVSIIMGLFLLHSLTVYLIVLVYISGVLVLMLYFSMLLSNMSVNMSMAGILILVFPSVFFMPEGYSDSFEFFGLFINSLAPSLLALLGIFLITLLIISMIFNFSKTIRVI